MPFREKTDFILLSASMISLPLSRKIDFIIFSCPITNLNRLWWFKLTKKVYEKFKATVNKFIKNYYSSSFFLLFQTKYTHLYTFHSLLLCVLCFSSTKKISFTKFSPISLSFSLVLTSQPTKAQCSLQKQEHSLTFISLNTVE